MEMIRLIRKIIQTYALGTGPVLFCLLSACEEMPWSEGPEVIIPADSIRFAVIGDYGRACDAVYQVSEMVKSWDPDFIITTGDNNYESGLLSQMHRNIGQYYCDYIFNWDAPDNLMCSGKATDEGINRFFPSLGNHDYTVEMDIIPYLRYFSLPGREDYYEFIWGPVHFFALNSMGFLDDVSFAEQKKWFRNRIEKSIAPFRIAYFHHPPYSGARHGSQGFMQWDFKQLGVTAVISGHDHLYSRIVKADEPGLVYFVNGSGGSGIRDCYVNRLDPAVFDEYCYNGNFGAMLVTASDSVLCFEFYSVGDRMTPVDQYIIQKK